MSVQYRCVTCGSDQTSPSAARPSLDERYVIGTCNACHKGGVTLVRVDLYKHAKATATQLAAQRDRADAAKAVIDPKHKGRKRLTPDRIEIGKAAVAELMR